MIFCNQVRENSEIIDFLKLTNITSIPKRKGSSRLDISKETGILSVVKFCSVIYKLIYGEKYEEIDGRMCDTNVGARKARGIRDNLFMVYASVADAISTKQKIDLHLYDLALCFDSMWWEETCAMTCGTRASRMTNSASSLR